MRVDNLGANGLKEIITRLEKLERATPMNNASIGRNGLRVHSGGVITIQNGGLSITGTASVIGQLIGSGVITWTGPVNFTGQTNLDGPVKIDGATTINGNTAIKGITTVSGPLNIIGDVDITKTLDITGDTRIMGKTTLSDDMTVTGGGKITAGQIKIDPASFGGTLWIGAHSIGGNTSGVFTNGAFTVGGDETVTGKMNVLGGVTMSGIPTITAAGKTPNLWQDPSTKVIYRLI